MSASGLREPHLGGGVLPVLRVLQTFSGIAAVVGLGIYSLLQTAVYEAPAAIVSLRAAQAQTAATGNAKQYPPMAVEPFVVHLACNQEDARWARVYDPPASGSSVILRIDQSSGDMRSLYQGANPQFPKNTRLVTTPCIQSMIDSGEFP